ncbi:hypothetical protein F0Z19_4493 [Vibrio cyclitrophicus]|nr:hypothetical protein F0Z19_4493 [Vibrio cyclitrophicus]
MNNIRHMQEYITVQNERSKHYIVLSAFSVLLVAALGYLTSLFIDLKASSYDVMRVALGIYVITLSVYWYLQVKPSSHLSKSIIDIQKPLSAQEKLSRINEIFSAIELIEKYQHHTSQDYDLSEVELYIEARRDVFPLAHEFGKKANKSLELTSNIRRELFVTSLTTIRTNLEQEELRNTQKAEQNTSTLNSQEEVNETVKLVSNFTSRLKTEIEQLSRKANIYIAFGSAITIGAAFILYYTVNDLSTYFVDPYSGQKITLTSSDWFSVISRFSIVLFVEVFAFYYLRLYRTMMDNIKFYQNEITNIELRLMALHGINTIKNPDSSSASALIKSLSNSERNFVIEKGQTTVDLEKQKIDSSQINSIFDGITKVTKTINK